MLAWIRRKAQTAILESADEDIDSFIAGVRKGSASEVGMIVAQATNNRNFLLAKGINLLAPTGAEQEGVFLSRKLESLIKDALEQDPADAPGWMVWLYTIRATNTPELRLKGHILWRELARGFPYVDDAAHRMLALTGMALNVEGYATVPDALEDDDR